MAERVLQHTVTIPGGTPLAAPVTVALPFDNWELELVELEVPPGPNGALGFVLANNGHPWIPRSVGEWLVWDDKIQAYVPTGYPTAGGWQIVGYNTGTYDHDVITRFHVNPLSGPAAATDLPFLTFVEHGVNAREVVVL